MFLRAGYDEWTHPDLGMYCKDMGVLWDQYRELRRIAERKGTRIMNATNGGLLDLFPRIDLNEAIDRIEA